MQDFFQDNFIYRGRNGHYSTNPVGETEGISDENGNIVKVGLATPGTSVSSNSLASLSRNNHVSGSPAVNGVSASTASISSGVTSKNGTDDQSLSLTSRGITLALG